MKRITYYRKRYVAIDTIRTGEPVCVVTKGWARLFAIMRFELKCIRKGWRLARGYGASRRTALRICWCNLITQRSD